MMKGNDEQRKAAMRSRISAIFLFFISLIGLAIGSALIGWLNDNVFDGPIGVGYSLPLTAAIAALVAVVTLAFGIGPLREAGSAQMDAVAASAAIASSTGSRTI